MVKLGIQIIEGFLPLPEKLVFKDDVFCQVHKKLLIRGNRMIDIEAMKLEIIERLKPLGPEKIILFGSYANGTAHEDSDIDLYIVTKDEFMPQNFKENSNIFLKYSNKMRDLQKKVPIDIVTHTKKMHEKFIKVNSSFCRDILQNGVKIYG